MPIQTSLSRTRRIGIEQSGVASMSAATTATARRFQDTKMSTNMEQFSYVSKLVALAHLYVELSLPLPAALRAAEADLPVVGSFGYLDGRSTTIDGAECAFPRPIRSGRLD